MADPAARSSGRKILVSAHGSRGDNQPIVALCLALQKAGFVVRLQTNENQVDFARSMGLDAVAGHIDVEKEIQGNPKLREVMAKGDNLKYAKVLGEMNKDMFPGVLARKIENFNAFKPDLLITTGLCLFEDFALSCANGTPMIAATLILDLPSKEQISALNEPRWAPHRLIALLLGLVFVKEAYNNMVGALLEQLPTCKPFLIENIWQLIYVEETLSAPNLVGFSPALKRIPADVEDYKRKKVHLTGFWTVSSQEQQARQREGDQMFGGMEKDALEAFLAQGAPPVYIGWGSMIAVSSEYMALLAVRTLMKTGLRGIVLKGYAGLEPKHLAGQPDSESLAAYAAENVLFVATAPHEWLFPKCSVIVQHGGAGTMAAAVRSGTPTVITPCAFDQFEHARIVAANGVGIGMKHLSKVKPASLASAVKRCAEDAGMRAKCNELAAKLQKEDGLGNAVRLVDDFITDEVATGKWRASLETMTSGLKVLKAKRPPGRCTLWGFLCCARRPRRYFPETADLKKADVEKAWEEV